MQKRILLIGLLLMMLISITSCYPPSTSPAIVPNDLKIENGLAILSYSSYEDIQGLFHIVGEIENKQQNNSEKNKVTATFYDEQGKPENSYSNYCYIDIIKSGDKSPFEIVCPSAPKVEGFSLMAEGQVTDTPPHLKIEIGETQTAINSDGYSVITGLVTNNNEKLINIGMVVCSFYDSNGTIVAVGMTFCDRHPLNPNETAGFSLVIDPNISSKISSHSFKAIGYE
jgi:hypothetical protein